MAQQSKVLKLLNDTMEIPQESDWKGAVGIEYGTVGEDGATASSGTVVIEATVSGLAWYTLTIKKPDASTALLLSAVGLGYVEATGWQKIRARMSVVGGANGVRVWANAKRS
jgi:hypothetical protein